MGATEVFGAQASLGILASYSTSARRSAGIRGERQSSELSVARLTMTPDLTVASSNQSVKTHVPAVRGNLATADSPRDLGGRHAPSRIALRAGRAGRWRLPLQACAQGPVARPVRHCGSHLRVREDPIPSMAAPSEVAPVVLAEGNGGGFGSWLDGRLEALGVDRAVYGAYILGVLREEEEEEKLDALQGILSAFLVSRVVRAHSSNLTETCRNLWHTSHLSSPVAVTKP